MCWIFGERCDDGSSEICNEEGSGGSGGGMAEWQSTTVHWNKHQIVENYKFIASDWKNWTSGVDHFVDGYFSAGLGSGWDAFLSKNGVKFVNEDGNADEKAHQIVDGDQNESGSERMGDVLREGVDRWEVNGSEVSNLILVVDVRIEADPNAVASK